MKRSFAFLSIVTTLVVMAGSAAVAGRQTGSSPAAGKGNVEAGKALYAKKCKNCHGAAGEGSPAVAKQLKVEIKHLGAPDVQQKSDEELRKSSVDGVGKMKPVKDVSAVGAADLVAYIRSLKQ